MTPLLGGKMLVLSISLVSYMAVDFLTIALSSAETEREDDHSIARSPKTLFVAKAQCVRSWSKIGVYISPVQLA